MKKINTKLLLIFLTFILLFSYACSENDDIENINLSQQDNFVSLDYAKKIANNINFKGKHNESFKGKFKNSKRTVKKMNEVKNKKGKTSFYIINYNEGGFIILSSDKRTEPILAFSEKGGFVVENESYPPGLKMWMEDAQKQITEIQSSNIVQSELNKIAWQEVENAIANSTQSVFAKEPEEKCEDRTETITVGPLMDSTWDQLSGYNSALPFITCYGSSFQVYAGCVPIAMGQVMRYYSFPTNYNWSAMPSGTASTTTANFIDDIHDAIGNQYLGEPSYFCGGTGVSASANMATVLKNEFGYSYASWSNYNYNTVKSNINSGRPVILSGNNGVEGHMWVCDGYKQTTYYYEDCTGASFIPRFYMNWGWGGNYDGYFMYDNFNPFGGTGFNNNKKMIYNIIP